MIAVLLTLLAVAVAGALAAAAYRLRTDRLELNAERATSARELAERDAQLEALSAERDELAAAVPLTGLVRLHPPGKAASYEGLLLGIIDDHYRLAKARMLVDTNAEHDVAIDGEAFVRCSEILYVQKVG